MQKLLKNENSGASLFILNLALFCPPVGLIQTRIKDKHSARDVDRQRSYISKISGVNKEL